MINKNFRSNVVFEIVCVLVWAMPTAFLCKLKPLSNPQACEGCFGCFSDLHVALGTLCNMRTTLTELECIRRAGEEFYSVVKTSNAAISSFEWVWVSQCILQCAFLFVVVGYTWCDAVWCSLMRCDVIAVVPSGSVHYSVVWLSVVLVRFDTVRCRAVPCGAARCLDSELKWQNIRAAYNSLRPESSYPEKLKDR